MRKVFFLLLLMSSFFIMAKTTYIPKYRTYIHIADDSDTIVTSNNLKDVEVKEKSGMFNIIVEHEDVTEEKVKAIKRAKRAANLAAFSAAMYSVSTAFSDNSLQYMVRSTNTQIASQLADIYSENANAEQKLDIYMWIENTSEEELMINDIERGLIWFVKASQNINIKLNNPDVVNLRISDIHNNHIRYAMVTAGSLTNKKSVDWEDDYYWFSGFWKKVDESKPDVTYQYLRTSKTDFTETVISADEFRTYKKNTTNTE